jgi:hypothetical protein
MNTTTYNRTEAAARARATKTNVPDSCQLTTREWVGAPSAGDFDGDGSADAEDGWKREPAAYKHFDRKPPEGTVVTYLGGSSDNGHRALSLGPVGTNGVYMIRSTDAGGRGITATVPLDWPEREWGLSYAGWSDTCDGYLIPKKRKPLNPLSAAQRIKVIRAAAHNAKTAGHDRWAARLNKWADKIENRAKK